VVRRTPVVEEYVCCCALDAVWYGAVVGTQFCSGREVSYAHNPPLYRHGLVPRACTCVYLHYTEHMVVADSQLDMLVALFCPLWCTALLACCGAGHGDL
jgi:hypothetical protein